MQSARLCTSYHFYFCVLCQGIEWELQSHPASTSLAILKLRNLDKGHDSFQWGSRAPRPITELHNALSYTAVELKRNHPSSSTPLAASEQNSFQAVKEFPCRSAQYHIYEFDITSPPSFLTSELLSCKTSYCTKQ